MKDLEFRANGDYRCGYGEMEEQIIADLEEYLEDRKKYQTEHLGVRVKGLSHHYDEWTKDNQLVIKYTERLLECVRFRKSQKPIWNYDAFECPHCGSLPYDECAICREPMYCVICGQKLEWVGSLVDIASLPDGTHFYVVNGGWHGYVTTEDDDKICYAGADVRKPTEQYTRRFVITNGYDARIEDVKAI